MASTISPQEYKRQYLMDPLPDPTPNLTAEERLAKLSRAEVLYDSIRRKAFEEAAEELQQLLQGTHTHLDLRELVACWKLRALAKAEEQADAPDTSP